ncbi:35882_t:CDS:2, partial [Racocetra persica]
DKVSYKTIKNCWRKTKILTVELDYNDLPQEDTSLYDKYLDDENEFSTVVTDSPTTIAAVAINSYDINETSRYESKSIKTEILPVLSHHNRLKQEETQTNIRLTLQRRVYGIHTLLRCIMEQNIVSK